MYLIVFHLFKTSTLNQIIDWKLSYPFHIITMQKLKQTKWPISNLIKLDLVKETQLELELKEKNRQ